MFTPENPMEARRGRDKQRYSGNTRQVTGCVPVDKKARKILLITQRKKNGGWVLPKGGWEEDESDRQAAARETYEEAGANGEITINLGQWNHHTTDQKTGLPKATFIFYEMEVENLVENWPEMNERKRKWFSYDEAVQAIAKPFMREIIERCSLAPSNKKNANSKPDITITTSEEERKDARIRGFSVVLITFFAFFVWLVSTKYGYGYGFSLR